MVQRVPPLFYSLSSSSSSFQWEYIHQLISLMGPILQFVFFKISCIVNCCLYPKFPCLLEFRHKLVNRQKLKRNRWKLTPHVVITGSLNTLQHNWQHSFTEGCSAKTCGSCRQTQTSRRIRKLRMFPCRCCMWCVSDRCHTVSSSSSCKEKVERREMLDSEWRERTEMAESDLRGVPMGGWGNIGDQWTGLRQSYPPLK